MTVNTIESSTEKPRNSNKVIMVSNQQGWPESVQAKFPMEFSETHFFLEQPKLLPFFLVKMPWSINLVAALCVDTVIYPILMAWFARFNSEIKVFLVIVFTKCSSFLQQKWILWHLYEVSMTPLTREFYRILDPKGVYQANKMIAKPH